MEIDLDQALKDIAARDKTTVNLLLNRTLRKFIEWDYYTEKFGAVFMFAAAANKIVEHLSDEQVRNVAKWVGKDLLREFVMFRFKKFSLDNILRAIRLWGLAGNFQYEERADGEAFVIVCKHDSGRRWSSFYEEAFGSLFQNFPSLKIGIDSTEDQVLLRLPTPKEAFLGTLIRELERGKR